MDKETLELVELRHRQAVKIARLAKITAELVEIDAKICAASRAAACKACDAGLITQETATAAAGPKKPPADD